MRPASLRSLAANEQLERQRRLWAVYVLFVLGHDATDLWEEIPDAHAPPPPGVAPEVQRAIVTYWDPDPYDFYVRKETDIRLLIEAKRELLLRNIRSHWDLGKVSDAIQLSEYQTQLYQAGLTDAKISRAEMVDCYLVEGLNYTFFLSEAGPFCCAAWRPKGLPMPQRYPPPFIVPTPTVKQKLADGGFLWLEDSILDKRFENYTLQVVYDPTIFSIRSLLFLDYGSGRQYIW